MDDWRLIGIWSGCYEYDTDIMVDVVARSHSDILLRCHQLEFRALSEDRIIIAAMQTWVYLRTMYREILPLPDQGRSKGWGKGRWLCQVVCRWGWLYNHSCVPTGAAGAWKILTRAIYQVTEDFEYVIDRVGREMDVGGIERRSWAL